MDRKSIYVCILVLSLLSVHYSIGCADHDHGEIAIREVETENSLPINRTCGGDAYMNYLFDNDPDLKQKYELGNIAIENELQQLEIGSLKRQSTTVYTVPVVVHIIYHTSAQNLSDNIIKNQIGILNKDYRRRNSDTDSTVSSFRSLRSDTGIQFILAKTDPNGKATTGITRTFTSTESFPGVTESSFNDQCKAAARGGIDPWNSSKYLNIWVCTFRGGVLGYATFPGGSAARDGVVINTNFFGVQSGVNQGPYNSGRTLTHEVGHWFNLNHVWGSVEGECSEDDRVTDTPLISRPSYGCQLTKQSCGNLNMVQNYMDYSNDNCMTLFTVGQTSRMRIELEGTSGRRRTIPVAYSGPVLGLDDSSSSSTTGTRTTGRLLTTTKVVSSVTTSKLVTTRRRRQSNNVEDADDEGLTTEEIISQQTEDTTNRPDDQIFPSNSTEETSSGFRTKSVGVAVVLISILSFW